MKQVSPSSTLRGRETLRQFRADPVSLLRGLAETDAPAVDFRLGRRKLTLIKDAEQIEELLVKRQLSFKKGPGLLRLRPVLGGGLLTVDGSAHRTNRRQLQPAFSIPKVAEYGQQMSDVVQGVTGSWHDGKTVDLLGEMSRLTLAIVSKVLFGSRHFPDQRAIGSAINDNLGALYGQLMRCPHHRSEPMLEAIDRELSMVTASAITSVGGDDLLSLLSGNHFGADERRDELRTFFLAGHESVGVALTWAWYALSTNPCVRAAFEREIDMLSPDAIAPESLPYTRAVVAETLRLYPPAWMFTREAIEDVSIGGVSYSPGSILVVAPIVTHRDPRYWDRPDEFDPGRWDSSKFTLSANPRFSYFPFGGGARRCIGEQFALTELPVVLATIGKKWRLDPPLNAPMPTFDPVVTLRPSGGLPMVISVRS
jgi:cytochrome P450